jgi:predicted glycosyltransferase
LELGKTIGSACKEPMAIRRLLMYSQDGMGLGHLRRSSNIAHEVLERTGESEVLILADSPATRIFAPRRGIDVLKLPTIVKAGSASWKSTNWRTGSLSIDVAQLVALRAHVILQVFRAFQPHAFLIDHMPVGALGELKPTLDFALHHPARCRLYLGLRDILDTPAVIRRAWTELGAYDYLDAFDAVMIYGNRDIYDSAAAYRLLPQARRIVYCDYVAPRSQHVLADNSSHDPFILFTGGGGADAFPLADNFLRALPLISFKSRMGALVLTGPNMPPEERAALEARAVPGVRIEGDREIRDEWFQRASAVVTMGGYNSLCEVLKWRKKALVVPRPGPSAEQGTRSRLFAERGLVRVLEPGDLCPERLAEELGRLLGDGLPDPANIPTLHGAHRAATILLEEGAGFDEQIAERLLPSSGNGALAALDPPRRGHRTATGTTQ